MRCVVAALLVVGCSASTAPKPEPAPAPPVELGFRGRIVASEEDPRPVAGARVRWVLDRRAARTPEMALRTTGEGRTDADGRFALPTPPHEEGYLALWCERGGGWDLVTSGLHFGDLASNGWDDAEGVLPERDTMVRMLVTEFGGTPIPGARVDLVLSADAAPVGDMRPSATTDRRGLVEIRDLESGVYWADISADGFAPVRMATHQFPRDADASQVDEHALPHARTLRCRVADPEGAAPRGAVVEVSYDSDRGGTTWFLPVRDDGTLDTQVPVNGKVTLTVSAPGYADATLEGTADIAEFTLDLVPSPK